MKNDFYFLFVEMMEKQQYVEVTSCHDGRYPDKDVKTRYLIPESHNFTHFSFRKPHAFTTRRGKERGTTHVIPAQNILSLKKSTHVDYSKKPDNTGLHFWL